MAQSPSTAPTLTLVNKIRAFVFTLRCNTKRQPLRGDRKGVNYLTGDDSTVNTSKEFYSFSNSKLCNELNPSSYSFLRTIKSAIVNCICRCPTVHQYYNTQLRIVFVIICTNKCIEAFLSPI